MISEADPSYPALYQINTRVWLRTLSTRMGQRVTLADVPDAELDRIAEHGFDWVWLLSVWQTGAAGRATSRTHSEWVADFHRTLPDLSDTDICGSGFAITGYTVADMLGGDEALASLRERLAARGLRLMLDFVPNHTAPDHPWVRENPDFFVAGTDADLDTAPHNFTRVETNAGSKVLARGRDPYFPGWPDTLQLDYGNATLQDARVAELCAIADRCDGVRCDMAMLVVPEVFRRTWGIDMAPFWPRAISAARETHPGFVFMAEVYWDMEWELQQQGFDVCYDKRLYDRLRDGAAWRVRDHLAADLHYQRKLVRFLENHDEQRAATTFPWPMQAAAAVVNYLAPGWRFFHQGQLDGRRVKISPHLCRGPDEAPDADVRTFYDRLLAVLREPAFRNGTWDRIEPRPADPGGAPGDGTHDGFVAHAWRGVAGDRWVVVVNLQNREGYCRLRLPFGELAGGPARLDDRLGNETYRRDGDELLGPGLFIAHRPWQANVFQVTVED